MSIIERRWINNQMKTERKGKAAHTEKINSKYHLDGVYTAHLQKEIFMIHGKPSVEKTDCTEKFVEHIEIKLKDCN